MIFSIIIVNTRGSSNNFELGWSFFCQRMTFFLLEQFPTGCLFVPLRFPSDLKNVSHYIFVFGSVSCFGERNSRTIRFVFFIFLLSGIPNFKEILFDEIHPILKLWELIINNLILKLSFFFLNLVWISKNLLFVEAEVLLGERILKALQDYIQAVDDIIPDHLNLLHIVLQVIFLYVCQLDVLFAQIYQIA